MQKKLLAVAVASALAMPGAAMAVKIGEIDHATDKSEFHVYGTIDGGLRQQSKIHTGVGTTGSQMTASDGLRTTNRWGFRGSENLGGGLMANFKLEGQYSSDSGAGPVSTGGNAGLFARSAFVGLSQGGNSVDIGNDYTANFKSQGIYDPMSYTYTGVTPTAGRNTAGVRSTNMVTAGFRFGAGGVRVDYALGEVVDQSWGTRTGIMGDFKFGPVTLTGAYSTMKDAGTGAVTTKTTNFGGAYGMGAFTFRAGMSDTDTSGTGGGNTPMIVFGVQYAMSPTLNGRVGIYDTKFENAAGTEVGKSKLAIVALDYTLSKRTIAYVEFDRRGLSGNQQGTTVGVSLRDGATAIGAGIAHSF